MQAIGNPLTVGSLSLSPHYTSPGVVFLVERERVPAVVAWLVAVRHERRGSGRHVALRRSTRLPAPCRRHCGHHVIVRGESCGGRTETR